MDSLSNGEVTSKSLNDSILSSDESSTEPKSKNPTKDLEGESPEISTSHAEDTILIENKSVSDPIQSKTENSNEKKNLPESSPEPKTTIESNIKSPQSVETTDDLNNTSESSTSKENGLSDTENLNESKDNCSISVKDVMETDNLKESIVESSKKTGSEKTIIIEEEESNSPKPDSNSETIKDKSDLKTTLTSSDETINKEILSDNSNETESLCSKASNKDKCSNDVNDKTITDCPKSPNNKCSNEVISPTNTSEKECVLNKVSEREAAMIKNNLMAGGSIISSADNENDKQNSNHSSETVDAEQIMDFSNKIMESGDASDVSKSKDSDEQHANGTALSNTDQSSEHKLLDLTKSDSESNKLGSLDEQESNSNETDSNEKLKDHLATNIDDPKLIADSNHIDKDNSNTSKTLATDAHCDKENESTDTSQTERSSKEASDTFVFADLTNEETGFPDMFTGLVKIGKYISVKGDFTLRSSEALVESPSLVAPYLLKEPDSFPEKDKEAKSEGKDFFHSAAGEILIGIGLSRVNEWFHKDMVRIKKRQLKRKKTPELEEDVTMHEKYYAEAKKANNVYSFEFGECKTCGFTTESSIIMEGHLLVPHLTQRREYLCNFCGHIDRDPKGMLVHMQESHRKIGRIQPPVLFFECPYCTYESNSKVKLNHHLLKCQRVYDQGVNQAPTKDFEFPALTPKPITVAVVKAYEKSLGSMHRGRGRPKKEFAESMLVNKPNLPTLAPGYKGTSGSPLADSLMQNHMMANMLRPAHSGAMGQLRPALPAGMQIQGPNHFFGMKPNGQLVPLVGNNHLVTSPSQFPFSTNLDNSGGKKSSASSQYYNKVFDMNQKQQNSKGASSVTITPLPKLTGPYPVPMAKPSTAGGPNQTSSNSLVVCEICDGYIKDLEQLRTHMQLIHKVKIHPKMLVSRPPLNCQKCQWRFFTDQGLERHLLGAHGLVTSNMQEMANKGKDAGCCTICGRVYASKLVNHMNQVHKISLKPAHLSYKCTVCSATFNLYRLFENHVYLVHSGAGKRSADGRSSPSKKLKSDSPADGESVNHKEKKLPVNVGDENAKKCKQCGTDMSKDTKSQSDSCEKCLKSDELVDEGSAKTLKDELKQKDKAIEKAAV